MTMTFEVTRTVSVVEMSDDDPCSLCPGGWYWLYQGERDHHGPYRSMDEAMSAASRGDVRETPAQASRLLGTAAVA